MSFQTTEKFKFFDGLDTGPTRRFSSMSPHAAAVYVWIATEDSISTVLLTAKSQVVPVKTVSLPRLELCGAVLAAEMAETSTSVQLTFIYS